MPSLCGSSVRRWPVQCFFLISNFAVWAAWEMYPKNFSGLMTSYTLAIPFFRNAVEGDLLFTLRFSRRRSRCAPCRKPTVTIAPLLSSDRFRFFAAKVSTSRS